VSLEAVSRRVGAGLFESVFGVNEDKDLHEFTGILAGVQQALSTITLSATTYGNETFTIRVRKLAHPSWVLANRTRQPEHRIERTLRVRVDEPAKSDQSEKKLPKEVRSRPSAAGVNRSVERLAVQCCGARAVQVFYFLCAALGLSVLLCCACCIRRRRRQHASVTSRIKRKGRPAHKQRFLLDKHAPGGARDAVAVPKLSAQQAAALHHELAADQMAGFVLLGGAVHDARVEALSGHALLLCEAHGSADELLRHAVHAEVGPAPPANEQNNQSPARRWRHAAGSGLLCHGVARAHVSVCGGRRMGWCLILQRACRPGCLDCGAAAAGGHV
jgi:hypothetical protein